MQEEKQDAQGDSSSPELQAAMEESAASEQQTQGTETPTPQQGESQEQEKQPEGEVPFHEHPRFKEVIDEKNWYKQQLEQQLAQQQQPVQQTQTPQNPYQGMTPEEERFMRFRDDQTKKIVQGEMRKVNPMLQAGLQEIASMKVEQFRRDHPDIKPNSPDEVEIANKIKMGYNPNDAYWSVKGPKGVQQAEATAQKKAQQRLQQKRQANVESSPGVSATSQPKPDETIQETFLREAKERGVPLPPSALP